MFWGVETYKIRNNSAPVVSGSLCKSPLTFKSIRHEKKFQFIAVKMIYSNKLKILLILIFVKNKK